MPLDRIQMDVLNVPLIVFPITNPVIGKTALPNLCIRAQFPFCAKGKTAFDKLHRPLKRNRGRNHQMKVIRHQNERM